MADEFNTWKRHFIEQARGLIPHERNFYKVSSQTGKGETTNIKMVTPTEQVVERARATLSQPASVYDPVTGIMQRTQARHKTISSQKRKRKVTKKQTSRSKKRKIGGVKRKKSTGKKLKRKKKTNIKKRKSNNATKTKKWWK